LNLKLHIRFLVFSIISFFSYSNFSFAQNEPDLLELIEGAEMIEYYAKNKAHRLIGPVNFKYKGSVMYCDSAHFFDKEQIVIAYGKVQLDSKDINLFCDSLLFRGKTRFAKLWGNVRVRDQEYKIETDSMDYDLRARKGIYRKNGIIESIVSNERLTSKVGYFYPESKDFFFSGNVNYRKDDLTMKTDTLQFSYGTQVASFFGPTKIMKGKTEMSCRKGWYNVQTEQGVLIGEASVYDGDKIIRGDTLEYDPIQKVFKSRGTSYYEDATQNLILQGNKIINDEQKNTLTVTGSACVSQKNQDELIQVQADTIISVMDSLKKQFVRAYRHVKVFNDNLQATSDSITFSEEMNKLNLFHNPIAWSENAEMKGDNMVLYLKDSLIEKIEIFNNSSVVMELDSGKFYNQLAGRDLIAYFSNQKLKSAFVNGNAQTIFFPQEEKNTDSVFVIKRKGMNRLYAGDLRLDLDSGEVRGVSYIDKPDGKFYPISKINKEEQFINSFRWNPILRPKKPLCLN
jgi:lipopolysaccharide export system protein LptA